MSHRKNYITSDPDRNIKIYENLLAKGHEFTSRDMLHFAMELHKHESYPKAIEFYLKFMDMDNITVEDHIYCCSKLADCYYHLMDREKELEFIFKTFECDTPRPEFCCRLGYFFLEKSQFVQAAFWYKLATNLPLPSSSWVIQNDASRTWLPHMQLGLCFYHIGKYELSYYHNKIALSYHPNDQNIISNMDLLEELIKTNNI